MRKSVLHMILLLALMVVGSCAREEIIQESPRLFLRLRFSSPAIITKDDVGDVSAEENENKLTSLQVWVYRHSDGQFLGYLEPNVSEFENGEERRLYISLDESVAKSRPDVDVYTVANLASTGLTLTASSTRDILNGAVLQNCFFGNASNAVPESGLPYSGMKTCDLVGNFPVLNAGSVSLEKAVSRLRFVFCQVSDTDGETPLNDFSITSISLDGNMIPTQEYLFNTSEEAFRVNSVYEENAVSIPVPDGAIPACLSPEQYAYNGQNAEVYESLINSAVSENKLCATPVYYFRESPLALTGSISYTIGNQAGSVPFSMHDAGDFARNHSWIVYVYYSSGKIMFTSSYTPWTNGGDFSLTGDDV